MSKVSGDGRVVQVRACVGSPSASWLGRWWTASVGGGDAVVGGGGLIAYGEGARRQGVHQERHLYHMCMYACVYVRMYVPVPAPQTEWHGIHQRPWDKSH